MRQHEQEFRVTQASAGWRRCAAAMAVASLLALPFQDALAAPEDDGAG